MGLARAQRRRGGGHADHGVVRDRDRAHFEFGRRAASRSDGHDASRVDCALRVVSHPSTTPTPEADDGARRSYEDAPEQERLTCFSTTGTSGRREIQRRRPHRRSLRVTVGKKIGQGLVELAEREASSRRISLSDVAVSSPDAEPCKLTGEVAPEFPPLPTGPISTRYLRSASQARDDAVAAHFAHRNRMACADLPGWFDDADRSRIHRTADSLRGSGHCVRPECVDGAIHAVGGLDWKPATAWLRWQDEFLITTTMRRICGIAA